MNIKAAFAFMLATGGAFAEPSFTRVWERRFTFDNEYPLPAGTYLPAAHYSAEVKSLPASMRFTDGDRTVLEYAAPTEVAPPFTMHLYLTGRSSPAVYVTKDGRTTLSAVVPFAQDFEPRSVTLTRSLRYGVTGGAADPKVSLTAGIGQADTRFVTTGRWNRPYVENGRYFFTFSSRGYGATLGVMSFDPAKLDFRMEGTILFDYGDGLLRNDLAGDLFYDDVADEWRAYVSNFSTGSDALNRRAEGGINCAWSKERPFGGVRIMRAKSLGLPGMNEDPDGFYDEASGRWRLLISEFTDAGIRASMWESDRWDGGFTRIAGPVKHDSTGTTIAEIVGTTRCLFGSRDNCFHVFSFPGLEPVGKMPVENGPWKTSTGRWPGRVWPAYLRTPDGTEYLLTFDRDNFPGMPNPNWTYGKLMLFRRGPVKGRL